MAGTGGTSNSWVQPAQSLWNIAAADNVRMSEPFMFRLKVPVRAGQAQTCLTTSELSATSSAAVGVPLVWH